MRVEFKADRLFARADKLARRVQKYSPDQSRDERGRWSAEGGGSGGSDFRAGETVGSLTRRLQAHMDQNYKGKKDRASMFSAAFDSAKELGARSDEHARRAANNVVRAHFRAPERRIGRFKDTVPESGPLTAKLNRLGLHEADVQMTSTWDRYYRGSASVADVHRALEANGYRMDTHTAMGGLRLPPYTHYSWDRFPGGGGAEVKHSGGKVTEIYFNHRRATD